MIGIKKRLKSLLPTLKEKNRYLVFELISDGSISDFKAVSGQIAVKMSELVGDTGMAKANIVFIADAWNKEKQRGIIKVSHGYVHELKSALAFVEKIDGKDVILRSVGLSGILNKAESRYMGG